MKSLNFEIHIPELIRDGHPYQEFASHEIVAFRRFDELSTQFPKLEVFLYQIKKELLKKATPPPIPKPIPKCPRGHTGAIDGKDVVREGSTGLHFCIICDWKEGE